MGCTETAEHNIEVTDPKPFKEKLRNISSGLLEEVKDHLGHMLNVGAIKPSKSAWSNAVVLVWKKDRGFRFCIGFQKLNTQTRKDAFPLPQIHDAINAPNGSKYYTTLHLLSRFWQTPPGGVLSNTQLSLWGHWDSFSVSTCPLGYAMLQQLPAIDDQLFRSLTCLVYLDDIIIYSSTQEEHIECL